MRFLPLLLALLSAAVARAGYDPLALPPGKAAGPVDLTVKDSARARDLPIRVRLPEGTNAAAVVLFSHGLGGSRENNAHMAAHWTARGYATVFIQHPGSDESVWRGEKPGQRMTAMREAASARNYLLRVEDVPAVIDRLERWNTEPGHPLRGRLDTARIGMSGHSFGALTTQSVSGQRGPGGRVSFTDPRIRAAVMFSPSPPAAGDPGKAFGAVAIPWLLLTGTRDESVIGSATPESRLAVYPALPAGAKYELVLHNAEHSAFSDRALPGDREPRNPNHVRAALALTTAFWDAHLRGDAGARAWLDGEGPAGILEKADRWQRK